MLAASSSCLLFVCVLVQVTSTFCQSLSDGKQTLLPLMLHWLLLFIVKLVFSYDAHTTRLVCFPNSPNWRISTLRIVLLRHWYVLCVLIQLWRYCFGVCLTLPIRHLCILPPLHVNMRRIWRPLWLLWSRVDFYSSSNFQLCALNVLPSLSRHSPH